MDVSTALECSICAEIMSDAVEAMCCHTMFCAECIGKWLQKAGTCPSCRKEISSASDAVVANMPIRRLIDSFPAECPHEGCKNTVLRGNLADHAKICDYAPAVCRFSDQCVGLLRKDLPLHLPVCDYRLVECGCGLDVALNKLAEHEANECRKAQAKCPNGCNAELIREQLPDHVMKQCPLQVLFCPLDFLGCQATMPRSKLEDHLKEAAVAHNALTLKAMSSQRDRIEQLQNEVATLKQENAQLNQNLETFRRIVPQLPHTGIKEIVLTPYKMVISPPLQNGSQPIVLDGDDLTVSFNTARSLFTKKSPPRLVLANAPVPDVDVFYYELAIENPGSNVAIGIGFVSEKQVPRTDMMPGWLPHSYGYHADDGKAFGDQWVGRGVEYGPTAGRRDVIGCGLSSQKHIFFTKNGVHLGNAFTLADDRANDALGRLVPAIGLDSEGCRVTVNFGKKPFCFDLGTVRAKMAGTTSTTTSTITLAPIRLRTPPPPVTRRELHADLAVV